MSELTDNDLIFNTDGNIIATNNITLQNSTGTTFTWPTTDPAVSGYVLSSTTGGTMSWVSNAGGGGSSSGAQGAIQLSDGGGGFDGNASLFLYDNFSDITRIRSLIATSGSTITGLTYGGSPNRYLTLDIRNNQNATDNSIIFLSCGSSGGCNISMDTGVPTNPASTITYEASTNITTITNIGNATPGEGLTLQTLISGDTGVYAVDNLDLGASTGTATLRTTGTGNIIIDAQTSGDINIQANSGDVTITPGSNNLQFILGATTYTWPTSSPAATGYVLSSTTGGTMSWVSNAGGGGSSSGAQGAIQLSDGATGFTGDASLFLYDNFTTARVTDFLVTNSGSTVPAIPPPPTAPGETVFFDIVCNNDTTSSVGLRLDTGATAGANILVSASGSPGLLIQHSFNANTSTIQGFGVDTFLRSSTGNVNIISNGGNASLFTDAGDISVSTTGVGNDVFVSSGNEMTISSAQASILRTTGNADILITTTFGGSITLRTDVNVGNINITSIDDINIQNSTGTTFTWPTTDPAADGYVLSSTTAGVMSWIPRPVGYLSGNRITTSQIGVGSNTDIIFNNQASANLLSLNTGTGVVTLQSNKIYKLEASIAGTSFSNTIGGEATFTWVNSSNIAISSSFFGKIVPVSNITSFASTPYTSIIYSTYGGADTSVKLRTISVIGTFSVQFDQSFFNIIEIAS